MKKDFILKNYKKGDGNVKFLRVLVVSLVVTGMLATSIFAADISDQGNVAKEEKSSISRNFKIFGGKHGIRGGINKSGFKQKRGNPTNRLVKAGTITQDQADKMLQIFPFKDKRDGCRGACELEKQDPIKVLENCKTKIQAMLKDGKITEEKANSKIAKIDEEIKKIKEFNALTLDQKKEKLTNDFKTFIQKQVQDGKLTQEKADEILKKFTDKLAKWDGIGYPKFPNLKTRH